MTTLTVELVQQKLLEKDEMKKVSYEKQKLSKHRKSKKVGTPKDPSTKMTKITQVTTPKEEGAKEDKGKPVIPQADFADTYVRKMPHGMGPGTGGKGSNQKSPNLASKGAKTTSMTPNQKTNLKQVKNAIKDTDDDGNQKAMTPGDAPFAHEITSKMPHGSKNLGTANGEGGQGIGKQSVAKMAGGPTRKGGERKAKNLGEEPGAKRADQISHKGNEMPQPSDAMKWRDGKFKWNKQGHNVVESGVVLKLGGKVKANFEVVSRDVLKRIVENYAQHGYKLVVERTNPNWKKDPELLSLLRETMHAKYNNVPGVFKALRRASLNRFGELVYESHSEMYESRDDFASTVFDAFKRILEVAEDKYLRGLNIYECTARITLEDAQADLEIVTQGTDTCMAYRNAHNQIVEEFGLDAKIDHIFVDGEKFEPDCDCGYKIREQQAMNAYRKMYKKIVEGKK